MDEKQAQLLVDRFLLAGFVEACRLLDEGIASARDIDLAMRAGAGYPQGPLAWADSMGLDVVLSKLEELYPRYGEAFAVPERLRTMVARGELGRKTHKGFFEYTGGEG
ncbi:MAG: 3-hydroxyacyl-CoA dehydrogenase family protein [Bacillota bacterium]